MIRTCQHCGELILGDAYRVTSEEDGVPLLNMVVCLPCSMEAKRLQLHTEPINPGVQHPSIQNGRSRHSRFRI
jgi:RNase P subunit RPR2